MNRPIRLQVGASLSESQNENVRLAIVILGSISVFVLSVCIALIVILRQYRKSHYHIILVLLLTFWPDSLIVSISQPEWQQDNSWCLFSAFALQFLSQGQTLLNVAIAINLYRMSVLHVRTTTLELKYYHWFIWTLCALLSFLPMTTESYGPATQWCWIDSTEAGVIWRFATLYVPMIFYFMIIFTVYFLIGRRLYVDRVTLSTGDDRSAKSKSKRFSVQQLASHKPVFRLLLFPLVFVIGWTPPLINRFAQLAHGGQVNYQLTLCHVIFRGMVPVLCCIVYLYPLVRTIIHRCKSSPGSLSSISA